MLTVQILIDNPSIIDLLFGFTPHLKAYIVCESMIAKPYMTLEFIDFLYSVNRSLTGDQVVPLFQLQNG